MLKILHGVVHHDVLTCCIVPHSRLGTMLPRVRHGNYIVPHLKKPP